MGLLESIENARAFLARNGRVSLRLLKREFDLDDAALDELVEELVDVQQVAVREGKALSWIGSAPASADPGADTPAAAPTEPVAATEAAAAERRQLTVMFCDLVGSTDLSQRLDAEDLREVVRAYQESAARAIEHYEGHVAQYLGDGLLAYFGYPRAHEDDAERAVRAGREILTALVALNNRLEPERGLRLAVRVGIHTGPVVVGEMGGGAKSETLALGDTTNIAARLESEAEPDSVVISAATLHLVPGMFATKDLGARNLKGIAEPIHVYAVLQATGVRSRLDVSGGRFTPFVGRQSELGVLSDAWEHAVEGMGRTVLVQGEAGLGKSRLCYELRAQLAGEPHTWLECSCSPYTSGTAFRPVRELVAQALDFKAADTPAEKLAKLSAGLTIGEFAADEAVPLLAEWLGLPESAGYTPLTRGADAKRSKTLETLAAWNLKLSELQPMVVLVEDLHWCDPSSLELLGRLVTQGATARVLLVGTARPEFESPWPARSNLQTLTLGRLTKRQAREMIAAVSAAAGLPEAVVEQLVARADGVPLYAEELTQSVVAIGGDASADSIPMTLRDSLLARLDRLSSAKEVAQRASVLGREFSYRLLQATAGIDEGALREGLARLALAELLFARGEPPAATYTFKHALVQEAAYESLLKRTRQQLHGRVVDVLGAEFPEQAAAEPELIARHAQAAGRIDDAIAFYQRAGEQARARSACEEAIRHLRQAIALLTAQPESRERDTREAALQLALGGSLAVARGYSHHEVGAAYERTRVLYEAVGDARGLGWALAGLSTYFNSAGQLQQGKLLATRMLTIAQEIGHEDLRLRGHIDVGISELWEGKFASSLAHFEAALVRYEPDRQELLLLDLSITDHDVSALAVLPLNLWVLGWPDRALARAREALLLARRIGHPHSLAYALVYESLVHGQRGDAPAQLERAAEAMDLSAAQGFPFWLGLAKTTHAAARVASGAPEAVSELMAGLAESGGTGSRAGAPALFGVVAEAYRAAGLLSEARRAVEGGLALSAQTGQPSFDSELHRLQGEIVLAEHGAPADVEPHFQRALDIARGQESRSLELRATTCLARLWHDHGKPAEARALLQPLYAWFTEGFDTQDLKDAKALLGKLG